MASLAALSDLPDVSYHDDWASVKQALQNWSVRDKFTYRTPCKDERRARYICTQPGCIFRVTGNKDRSGRITVRVVNRWHTCTHATGNNRASDDGTHTFAATDDENTVPILPPVTHDVDEENDVTQTDPMLVQHQQRHRNAATQMKWLVTAIERVLNVTTATKPADIRAAAKEYYNEQISYQQAFRCLRLLTADIKEQGHRERVPDELRKAIVALRVFVDPPMDWTEIERKTGVKARTAGYVFASAEKKSGGSTDPLVLLKNATVSVSGPKAGSKIEKSDAFTRHHLSDSHEPLAEATVTGTWTHTSSSDQAKKLSQSRKKRKTDDEMIDPNLEVTMELTQAAAEMQDYSTDEATSFEIAT